MTQYELWKALWSSAKDVNAWELAHAIERHDAFSRSFIPNTFTGNHDVNRIASVVTAEQAAALPYLLMSLPGTPSIYYGDEQGFTGMKAERFGGDDDVRPPLPDSPADLSPLGAPIHRHYQAAIGFRRRHPWLATSSVEVLHKSNEALSYRSSKGECSVTVHLDLAAGRVRLEADDETLIA